MNIQDARNANRRINVNVSPRRQVKLITTTSVDEEIFAALEYVSEIQLVAEEFFTKRGNSKPKRTYKLFQAFIRQGKTFYFAGKQLHFRASPLMYYYAFLNLVKAYISISDPDFVIDRVNHGLTWGKFTSNPLPIQRLFITTQYNGVYRKFFELERGRLPKTKIPLNINRMLGYCTDVKYEYELAGLGTSRILRCQVNIFGHGASDIYWPLIAVNNYEKLQPFKKTLIDFNKYFHQVSPQKSLIFESFGISAEQYSMFSFFESNRTYPLTTAGDIDRPTIANDVYFACKPMFESPIYDENFDFSLALPLRLNYQIPFSQPLAIYATMYFIGSLVRYRPDYLEELFNSKDAWIIERFVRSSAITFLRNIGNAILGKDYIYSAR